MLQILKEMAKTTNHGQAKDRPSKCDKQNEMRAKKHEEMKSKMMNKVLTGFLEGWVVLGLSLLVFPFIASCEQAIPRRRESSFKLAIRSRKALRICSVLSRPRSFKAQVFHIPREQCWLEFEGRAGRGAWLWSCGFWRQHSFTERGSAKADMRCLSSYVASRSWSYGGSKITETIIKRNKVIFTNMWVLFLTVCFRLQYVSWHQHSY